MKVKCKIDVQDKYTGEMYITNKEYDLTEERAAEVVSAYDGRYFEYAEEITEEVAQAVAIGIAQVAEEENKTVEEVVNEIVEEVKQEKPKRVRKSTK